MNTMIVGTVERYMFDRGFNAAAAPAVPHPQPMFTAEDLERARADGLARGRAEIHANLEARRAAEHRRQEALDAIVAELAALQTKIDAIVEHAGLDAVHIAIAVARTLLPQRYREDACPEIEALVRRTLRQLPEEPMVTVRVADTLLTELEPRLLAIDAGNSETRRLRIIGSSELAEGNCRIDWHGGGIIRDQQMLWREIESLVNETTGSSTLPIPSTSPSLGAGIDHV